jgi:hypothetical protein
LGLPVVVDLEVLQPVAQGFLFQPCKRRKALVDGGVPDGVGVQLDARPVRLREQAAHLVVVPDGRPSGVRVVAGCARGAEVGVVLPQRRGVGA